MRNAVLYIAVSLDGYIADSRGSVDWIGRQDCSVELRDTFSPFIEGIDTVVMGRRTYDAITTELSVGCWPYGGAVTYVLTHRSDLDDTENIRFRSGDVCRLVDDLKREDGKGIWICGGADIVNQLMETDLIDVFHIAIIPVLLGGGKRLFDGRGGVVGLRLVRTEEYNGVVELVYCRR